MEFLYQIHNVGIYLNGVNAEWCKRIKANIKVQFDGFEIYKNIREIEYRLIIQDMKELDNRRDAVVVPECSYSYDDGTMRSEYINVGYQMKNNTTAIMWTADETWYAPYLLEILFEKQGLTFVHGASVSVDSKTGKLLLAFGGIGKTCFIANAAKKSRVKMLGDDLILVSKTGELYSYPRPFCLYEYHQVLFPQFFQNNKIKYQHVEKNMYFKRGIRKLKKILKIKDNNVYTYIPVSPVRLFPKEKIQIEPVNLCDIFILRRNQNNSEITVHDMLSVDKAANFAIDVILHEWDIGLKVILNHHAQNFCSITDYITPRYNIIHKAFEHADKISCVDIPENMSATEVSYSLNNIILRGIE